MKTINLYERKYSLRSPPPSSAKSSSAWSKILLLVLAIYVSHVATYNLKRVDAEWVAVQPEYDQMRQSRMVRKPSGGEKQSRLVLSPEKPAETREMATASSKFSEMEGREHSVYESILL